MNNLLTLFNLISNKTFVNNIVKKKHVIKDTNVYYEQVISMLILGIVTIHAYCLIVFVSWLNQINYF